MSHQKLIIFLLIFIVLGCDYPATYTNRKKDKAEAEIVADRFYSFIKQNNYPATVELFSAELLKESPKEKIFKIFEYSKRHLGNLKMTALTDWETKVIVGTSPSASYYLKYINTYDSATSSETLRFIKDHKKQIKISSYYIDSDKFYKK